jgi:hydrogenase maturation factor
VAEGINDEVRLMLICAHVWVGNFILLLQ